MSCEGMSCEGVSNRTAVVGGGGFILVQVFAARPTRPDLRGAASAFVR